MHASKINRDLTEEARAGVLLSSIQPSPHFQSQSHPSILRGQNFQEAQRLAGTIFETCGVDVEFTALRTLKRIADHHHGIVQHETGSIGIMSNQSK